jgi:hypothetical protein
VSSLALRELVQRALEAIRADSADYKEPLRTLAESSAQLAPWLGDALLTELFAELRKLRPVALWVRDRATVALAQKRLLQLDGALLQLAPGDTVPAAEGRECWLELSAQTSEHGLRSIPSGFGLLFHDSLHDLAVARIRRSVPLRALGVVCRSAAELPEARLDLVLGETDDPTLLRGARVLCAGLTPEAVRASYVDSGLGGIVCDASHALSWALRLAVHRP